MLRPTLAVLLALLPPAVRAGCVHSFDASHAAVTLTFPGTVDFNGDGKPDLLRSDSIDLGGGHVVSLPQNGSTNGLRVANVNGDKFPDLVGGNDFTLIALINKGDATFTVKTTPRIRAMYSIFPSLLWGDFNGDGLLDVFPTGVFDPTYQTTPVYLAKGDGTFTPEFELTISRFDQQNIVVADVNGDKRADIVLRNPSLKIYLRRADFGFSGPLTGPTFNGTFGTVADFDRDGRDDLSFQNFTQGGYTTTLVYDVMGPTRAGAVFPGYADAPVDLDGDGSLDMVIHTTTGDFVTTGTQIYLNDGRGSFRLTETLPGNFTVSAVADFDHDGVTDIAVPFGGKYAILRGNGDGTFDLPRIAFPPTPGGVTGDFDGDGDDDIATPTAIAWNNGDDTFRITAHTDERLQHPVRAADLDGDGKAELITTLPNIVFIFSLRPDGTFVEKARIGAQAIDVAPGDFTGKHQPQLAMIVGVEGGIQAVMVFNAENFASGQLIAQIVNARGIAAADFNGDGRDDIVVAGGTLVTPVVPPGGGVVPSGSYDGFVSTFVSTGGAFEAERRMTYPDRALRNVVTGDFNGDGKTDAAASTIVRGSGSDVPVVAFYGDGTGALPRVIKVPFAVSAWLLRAADLNGDGMTDLAVNGAARILYGAPGGLVDAGSYFGPDLAEESYGSFVVRRRPGELPSIIVPTKYSDVAFVYRPLCNRSRAMRH